MKSVSEWQNIGHMVFTCKFGYAHALRWISYYQAPDIQCTTPTLNPQVQQGVCLWKIQNMAGPTVISSSKHPCLRGELFQRSKFWEHIFIDSHFQSSWSKCLFEERTFRKCHPKKITATCWQATVTEQEKFQTVNSIQFPRFQVTPSPWLLTLTMRLDYD